MKESVNLSEVSEERYQFANDHSFPIKSLNNVVKGDFKEAEMELQLLFWLPVSKFSSTGTIIRRQILENLFKEGVKIAVPQIRIVERFEDQPSTSSGLG